MKKILNIISCWKQMCKAKFALLKTSIYIKLIETPIKNKYIILEKFGEGKDGVTYVGKIKNQEKYKYIIKIMSRHAKKYSFIIKLLLQKKIFSDHLISGLEIFRNHYHYPYLELEEVRTTPNDFIKAMKQICDLQISLLKNGLIFWDLGVKHANYMISRENQRLVITDYGGSGFLITDGTINIRKEDYKKNLVLARDLFVKGAIFCHILCYALGKKQFIKIASEIQYSNEEKLKDTVTMLNKQLVGTIYGNFGKLIMNNSTLDIKTWQEAKIVLDELSKKDYKTQESADIGKVEFDPQEITVTGYQNYIINKKSIKPIKGSGSKLWDSHKKYQFVCEALEKHILNTSQPETFIDIGANLGMNVFIAKIKYDISKCYGHDYNKDYTDMCNKITSYLGLTGCFFSTKSFNNTKGEYDIVIAMGLIHHLYHRTEDYGNLEPILDHFSKITKQSLVLEFPTEDDKKAEKWTKIPGRKQEDNYTLKNFLKYAQKYFREIKEIGRIGKTRITYLLKK